MTCACISYNRPDLGGTVPAVVLRTPAWINKAQVEVDACIATVLTALWTAGVQTLGCCCGHNGQLGAPSVVLQLVSQMDLARTILLNDPARRTWQVLAWVAPAK